jgi:hypothetical protein
MAANWPITIEQGSTFSLPITIKNSDGTIFDLTPWTGRGQIRRHYRSTTIVASFTCTVVAPPTLGRMVISLSGTITAAIPAGDTQTDPRSEYFYDIEIENSGTTEVRRILNGIVYVSPEVTR